MKFSYVFLSVTAVSLTFVSGDDARTFLEGPRKGRQLKYIGYTYSGSLATVQVRRNINDDQLSAISQFMQRPAVLDDLDSDISFFRYAEAPYNKLNSSTLLASIPYVFDVESQVNRPDQGRLVEQCGTCLAPDLRVTFPSNSTNWGPFCDQIWDTYTGAGNFAESGQPSAVALLYYDTFPSNGSERCSLVALESFVALPHHDNDAEYIQNTCREYWTGLQDVCDCGEGLGAFAGGLRVAFRDSDPLWRFSVVPNGPGCSVADNNPD